MPRRLDERAWTVAFVLGASATGLGLLWLGAGMTFFADEWALIEARSLGDPATWLPPHNEHWSTLPILLYRGIVETIGIGSYVPYQAVVIALHLGVAFMIFRLVRRRLGPVAGFAAGLLVLLFGSGFENLYWGFQTGLVGSMLLGLLALDVIDGEATTRRAAVVAGLLVLNLMSSGIGLLFFVAVGVEWLLEARWRRFVPILAAPAAAYAGWYLAFGRGGSAVFRNPFTLEALADVPPFVLRGIANAGRSITALPEALALVFVGGTVALAGWLAAQRRLPGRVPGLFAAILTQYTLTGLVRGNVSVGQVEYTRYTYVSGILLLLALATLAAALPVPDGWRWRRPVAVLAGAVLALALGFNLVLLAGGRALFLDRADMTRALVTAGLARPLPPETDPERSLVLVPSPVALERIADAYGDPRTDVLVPGGVRPIPPEILAEAQRRLEEGAPIPQPEG